MNDCTCLNPIHHTHVAPEVLVPQIGPKGWAKALFRPGA
jgi:hypothetical protein